MNLNTIFDESDLKYLKRINKDITDIMNSDEADLTFNAFERLLFVVEKLNIVMGYTKELEFRHRQCGELLENAKCGSGKGNCNCPWCFEKNRELEFFRNN